MVRHSHTTCLRYERCRSHRSPTPPWLGRRQIDQDQREPCGGDHNPEQLIRCSKSVGRRRRPGRQRHRCGFDLHRDDERLIAPNDLDAVSPSWASPNRRCRSSIWRTGAPLNLTMISPRFSPLCSAGLLRMRPRINTPHPMASRPSGARDILNKHSQVSAALGPNHLRPEEHQTVDDGYHQYGHGASCRMLFPISCFPSRIAGTIASAHGRFCHDYRRSPARRCADYTTSERLIVSETNALSISPLAMSCAPDCRWSHLRRLTVS